MAPNPGLAAAASATGRSFGFDRRTSPRADTPGGAASSTTGSSAEPRLHLAKDVSLEQLGESALLFLNREQELHRLDGSGALLAARLKIGAKASELVDELAASGVDLSVAKRWTARFLLELSQMGVLAADLAAIELSSPHRLCLHVSGLHLELTFSSAELFNCFAPPYDHLVSAGSGGNGRFQILEWSDFVLIQQGRASARVAERSLAAIQLKGMILEQVLASAGHMAAFHSACLVKDGRALLLLGSPGAGKTTLSLALLGQGYTYAADDVTLLQAAGGVTGVPLAPSVKESAWSIVESLGPNLLQGHIHQRPDGQRVRFASMMPTAVQPPAAAAAIVRLNRVQGQVPRLAPVTPEDALISLMRESRSHDGRCSPEIMGALVALVRGARCFDLHYGDARDAAPLLRLVTADE